MEGFSIAGRKMAGHETRVLHVPTLIFVVGLINFLQACAFWIVGFHNRRVKGLGWWAAAAFCNGMAMPLIVFRQLSDSAVLTKLLPTTLNFASAYLFYVGAVRFRERGTVQRWPLLAALPFYGVFAWLILNDEGLRYRPVLTSPVFILFLAMGPGSCCGKTGRRCASPPASRRMPRCSSARSSPTGRSTCIS